MAKKSKSPNNNDENAPSVKPDESPNIFNKLFGETPDEEQQSNSLFSSQNPFRRKPSDNPQAPLNPIPKKRTVDEKSRNLEAPVTPDDRKKVKKERLDKNPVPGNVNKVEKNVGLGTEEVKKEKLGKNPNLGNRDEVKLDGGLGLGENSDVGNVVKDDDKKKKKKKKRKRDELEREYEERKYGVVQGDEEERKNKKVVVGKKRKEIDNPADMMVAQEEEGYDDESKLLRTVFVGNLHLKIKKKVLIKEFSQFGEIDSVRIRSVPTLDGKKPKKAQILTGNINEAADSVHAYIVFKSEQAAEASLAHNMSVVEGNHIRVDRACPPRKKLKGDSASAPLYTNKRTVFVGNLPFDVKDEELYQLFCGIKDVESGVEAVRVIRDRATSLGKGIAYVLFRTREAANLVCKKRFLKIRDRELRICHAKADTQTTPPKRKATSPSDSESTPSKKFSSGGKHPQSRYKVNTNGSTSYQGLRTSKPGEKKRTPSRHATPAFSKPQNKKGEKVKQRKEKRPSVAARKVKALAEASKGGDSKRAGHKRKMDARTPQSSDQKKKFKKSK